MFAQFYAKKKSQAILKKLNQETAQIGNLASKYQNLPNEELRQVFQSLNPDTQTQDAFAIIREMSNRILGLRQFDVQIVGGLALLSGKLAEMRTGEGKTLTVAAPAAIKALHRKGVHVITANSYLANRDAAILQPLYNALGLSVVALREDMTKEERKAAYQSDIIYGIGSDFGFDYLKDNLLMKVEDRVQRELFFAIVDEVDSILIDEARIPMIISKQDDGNMSLVQQINQIASKLKPSVDFTINLKDREALITEAGYHKIEKLLVEFGICEKEQDLYAAKNLFMVNMIHAAVNAYSLYRKDKDYVVDNGELLLVDQGTGRIMDGRRLQNGLHEALEAKEGLSVQPATMVTATITFQNFFSKYQGLSGLTGTALTEAEEFLEIYGLETVVIPTNKPLQRVIHPDVLYKTRVGKHASMANKVKELNTKKQPVLIGFGTINEAEQFSAVLKKVGVVHEVLSAKHIAREADIIANAGNLGSVTIATNMAGRGTDISLGGEKPDAHHFENEQDYLAAKEAWQARAAEVAKLGGLFVIGGERNGIRRVDNQLAGRCARQGDPGEVQFHLSLEDELIKLFAGDGKLKILEKFIEQAGGALTGNHVSKMLDTAQQRVEQQGFAARKEIMKYDGVIAKQRETLFDFQNEILLENNIITYLQHTVHDVLEYWIANNIDENSYEDSWDVGQLKTSFAETFGFSIPIYKWVNTEQLTYKEIVQKLHEAIDEQLATLDVNEQYAKEVLFTNINILWPEHLTSLMELEKNMGIRSIGGKNPVLVFQEESFELYMNFKRTLESEFVTQMLSTEYRQRKQAEAEAAKEKENGLRKVIDHLQERWIGRNEPCPCGSGTAYKKCHGKIVQFG